MMQKYATFEENKVKKKVKKERREKQIQCQRYAVSFSFFF